MVLARTLALRPRLSVIDDPVSGVELSERDPLLSLLRSLADEGTAVLGGISQSTALSEADRALHLHDGELATVVFERAPALPFSTRPRLASRPQRRAG